MRMKILLAILCMSFLLVPGFAKQDIDKLSDSDKLKYISDIVSVPEMEIWGTEYAIGENAKIWLQLLDEDSHPIENSTCMITTWFPNNTFMFNQTPMSYLDEGIHYKNFVVPNVLGVYPQTAICSVPQLVANFSTTNYTTLSFDDFETGDGFGGYGWVTDWGFDSNSYCSVSSINIPIGNYHIRCTGVDGEAFRISVPIVSKEANISFWAKFDGLESGDNYYFEQYIPLNSTWNTLKSWSDGDDDDIYRRYEYLLTNEVEVGILFRIRAEAGSGDYGYFDNISIKVPEFLGYYEVNGTEYQYIFGSGEIHVSDPLSNLAEINISYSLDKLFNMLMVFGTQDLVANHNSCLDNNTLLHTLTYENCLGSECFTYQRNETQPCAYGCYEEDGVGYCVQDPMWRYVILVAVIFGIVILAVIVNHFRTRM